MSEPVNTVGIVLARGGSKRIPRKNIKEFLGKPLVGRTIDALVTSGLFDRIVVSTDDAQIASVSVEFGAEVPFARPQELADDHASTDMALLHAIAECKRVYGSLQRGCCVYPTPFLTGEDLERGLKLLREHDATSAFPVVEYDFPVEQAFLLDGPRPRARWPEMLELRSQDLATSYHDAGMFYWFDVAKYERARELYCDDAVAFPILPEHCQDINTAEDWRRAEMKYRIMKDG